MIELYLWDSCPFCTKVLKAADDMGLQKDVDYTIVDGAPGTPGMLVVQNRGGKAMVPFLIDGDTSMYESDDIIAYIKEKMQK